MHSHSKQLWVEACKTESLLALTVSPVTSPFVFKWWVLPLYQGPFWVPSAPNPSDLSDICLLRPMCSGLCVSTLILCVMSAKSGRRPKPWHWVWVDFVVSSLFFFFVPPRLALPEVVQCQQVGPVYSCCFWLGHLSGLVTAEVWSAASGEQQLLGPCNHSLFHGCVHPKLSIPVLSLIPKPGSALGSPAAGPASVTADTRSFGLSLKAPLDMFGQGKNYLF